VVFELHATRRCGEEGVVFSKSHVEPRTKSTSALPHEDRAAFDNIAIKPLDTQALRLAVTTVS